MGANLFTVSIAILKVSAIVPSKSNKTSFIILERNFVYKLCHDNLFILSFLFGHMKKKLKVVGFDIDETLADLMTGMIDFLNARGYNVPSRDGTHSFDLWKVWNCEREESFRRVEEYQKSGGYRILNRIEGALEVVREIKRRGHRLVAITSRPAFAVADTEEWMAENFPDCFEGIYYSQQYSKLVISNPVTKGDLCAQFGVGLYVEDAHHHALEVAQKGTDVCWLYKQPWNPTTFMKHERVKLVDNIQGVLEHL